MSSKRADLLDYLTDTLFPSIKESAGYQVTVRKVERGFRLPSDLIDGDFPALFLADTDESRQNITRNQFQATIILALVGYAKAGNAANVSQREADKLIEDVTKCLETDRSQGGLVKWTEIKRINTFGGDGGPQAAFVMDIEFVYVSEGVTP
jgi:hypothetical protein